MPHAGMCGRFRSKGCSGWTRQIASSSVALGGPFTHSGRDHRLTIKFVLVSRLAIVTTSVGTFRALVPSAVAANINVLHCVLTLIEVPGSIPSWVCVCVCLSVIGVAGGGGVLRPINYK